MPMSPRLLRPRQTGGDPDALLYIAAVQAADGQPLEAGVRKAISDFVVGCKRDNIWSAIKACCILAGARTLAGALTPLVGAAPTNNNFVSGDYNRRLGLLGNGTTKNLDSNRNNATDPQNSKHIAVYKSENNTSIGAVIGIAATSGGASWIFSHTNQLASTVRVNAASSISGLTLPATGFIAVNRSTPSGITYRFSQATTSASLSSATPTSDSIRVFSGAGAQFSNARLSFYSIGESLDLALLDARVSALYTAIGAAIP